MKSGSWIIFIAMLGLCPVAAGADAPWTDPGTRYEYLHYHYRLNPDATHVETVSWAMTVLAEREVKNAKQTTVSYSTSLQAMEVLEAYTRKADGRRIDAPPGNYQVESNFGRDARQPVFSDLTTMTAVFPEVAAGDTVVFSYRLSQSEAMFPGQFSARGSFSPQYSYDEVSVTVDAPASLWAQHQGRQMEETISEQDGRRVITWSLPKSPGKRSKRRDFSVWDGEQEPGYAYSTFRSYGDIAEAYGARARAKAMRSDRVRQLAAEIVGERTAPREQAQALYEWVARRITYAGNCIGLGAVVPRDIDFILDNRMGDCKDHATLYQALLAARGIPSSQALINAGSAYRLPRVPVVSMVNHVLNYLPTLNLYADTTAANLPFG